MKTDTDLQIDFAGTFYTLWSVSSEAIYSTTPHGVHYLSNVKSIKTYHQNLSKDLESAQAKAKKMGCQNLMPDDSLKGRKKELQLMARILAGKVEVVAVSNLSPILEELNKWEVRVNVANPKTKIEREFNDVWKYGYAVNVVTDMEMTRKTYRGFEYYTPAGKRSFKKTIFTVNNENLILI